ncbi:MAG: aminotransferase class V-fold PLP-dependent enzyme [Cyclobacteriaceae bacterium]|nr:aminotransferase class V-fold PLP-dependent enzyme [Cyclobacteriaceae bacterium]
MLSCQKEKFSLPEDVSYLNCAYFSPLLNQIETIGHEAISKKRLPYQITIDDFFNPVKELKQLFAQLIDVEEHERVSLIPGVSYGIANVAKNISIKENENIVVVAEQFPSNMYSWIQKVKDDGGEIKTAYPSTNPLERGETWNESILKASDENTKVVAIANVHWTDGTLFDLKAIRQQCDKFNAFLIIDGSQSIGALPFSVKEIKPDALICAGYKWLLGPYSLGMAYYNEKFDEGIPIEECWVNRFESEDFRNLANYQDMYKPKASRYNVSESSNFILVPMLAAAIKQILEWTPAGIQDYCYGISKEAIQELKELECIVEDKAYRANHLLGIRLGKDYDIEKVKESMTKNNVYVSFRGNAIRVAPHLYNTENDFDKLVHCIKENKK